MSPNYPDIFAQLPEQVSTFAAHHDSLFYFIFWVSVVLFFGILAAATFFIIRFRRTDKKRAVDTPENMPLEVAWTVLPLIPLAIMFHLGFQGYVDGIVAPADTLDVRVKARQWSWEFIYPDGTASPGTLAVPVDKPVRLVMSSEDVIHSFYVPEFRAKRDVVPGMFSTMWFQANRTGEFTGYCTEYCGAPINETERGHFGMLATVKVLKKDEFKTWLEEAGGPPPGKSPAEWGEMLFNQYACGTCHAVEKGVTKQGPSWVGIWGREENLEDGSKIKVDENYIAESIREPNAKRVAGYNGIVMPAFALNDDQVSALIEYMKTLK